MSREWMRLPAAPLHGRRQVDNDVARKLVAPDMRDQTNPRRQTRRRRHRHRHRLRLLSPAPRRRPGYRRRARTLAFALVLAGILVVRDHLHRPAQDLDAGARELGLELGAQHGARDAAAGVAAAVAAHEDEDVAHVAHAAQQRAVDGLAREAVAVDGREAVVHGVEAVGQEVAAREGLDAVEGDAREEGDVAEAGEEVGGGGGEARRVAPGARGRGGGREGGVEDGDVVEGLWVGGRARRLRALAVSNGAFFFFLSLFLPVCIYVCLSLCAALTCGMGASMDERECVCPCLTYIRVDSTAAEQLL